MKKWDEWIELNLNDEEYEWSVNKTTTGLYIMYKEKPKIKSRETIIEEHINKLKSNLLTRYDTDRFIETTLNAVIFLLELENEA